LVEGDDAGMPTRAKIADFDTAAWTRAYASPKTTAYQCGGLVSELDAAVGQHEWSWAATMVHMLLGRCGWKDHYGSAATLAALRAATVTGAAQGVGDFSRNSFQLRCTCLDLCARCITASDPLLMRDAADELRVALVGARSDSGEDDRLDVKRDGYECAQLHNQLGGLLYIQLPKEEVDFARAEAHLTAFVSEAVELYGEASPQYATSLNNLAGLLDAQVSFERMNGVDVPDTGPLRRRGAVVSALARNSQESARRGPSRCCGFAQQPG